MAPNADASRSKRAKATPSVQDRIMGSLAALAHKLKNVNYGNAAPSPGLGDAGGQEPTRRLTLMTLPAEVQLLVFSRLPFASIVEMRRTCRYYRDFLSPPVVRTLFDENLTDVILSHCHLCMRHDPTRKTMLRPRRSDPKWPLASQCIYCAAAANRFVVGQRHTVGTSPYKAWVCRWCGYPVPEVDRVNQPNARRHALTEFHANCLFRYDVVSFAFFLLGLGQASIVIVGSALCWRYFKHNSLIIGAATAAFFLAIACLLVCLKRYGNESRPRTYHLSLLAELGTLALWASVMYALWREMLDSGRRTREWEATVAFAAMNNLFRLLNSLGYLAFLCGFKFWRRKKPGLNPVERLFNSCNAGLLFWTYPRAVLQEYPARFWPSKRDIEDASSTSEMEHV